MIRSPYPQVPVDEAVERALAAVSALSPVNVAFESAIGLVLASPVQARESMPPFAASSRDGYAIRASSAGANEPLRVIGEAVAGLASDLQIGPGEAARITTGAPIPDGADAVVMVENTTRDGDTIRLEHSIHSVSSGENIRPIGQDYPAGATILDTGTVIGAADLGLLASVGATVVSVHPRPRVAILSTGDELVPPDTTPGPGQIRDSNRFALAAAAREAGADVISSGRIGDESDELSALQAAIASADVVVTSGGVSMGHRDRVKPWLAEYGEIVFGRVRTKPGKPVTLAIVDETPVFALPGFPVSALVSFEVFARPALLKMAGHAHVQRPRWPVRAGHDLSHADDRVEFQRANVSIDSKGLPIAFTTGFQGSGRLLSMSGANALLLLPEGTGQTAEGTMIEALIVGPIHGSDRVLPVLPQSKT